MSERPDFVIAGAAKCGTTALFEYLSQHPRIFIPSMKEPKFFCSDLKTTGGVYTLDEYRALFANAPADCVTGEASTLYLYSRVAIESIMAHNPKIRVVVMLRHPVDAAHSLHAARWSRRLENIGNFEDAWHAQEARLDGEYLPPGWPDGRTLQYGPMYRYAEQMRRLFEWVPEEQRHVIVYEEFFADARRHYRELLDFLRVPPDARRDFPVVNPAIGPRSSWLERLLREPPAALQALYRPMRSGLHALGLRPGRWIWSLNSTAQRKAALRPAFRAELERYFAADIAELQKLLGRALWPANVSAWADSAEDRRVLERVIFPGYRNDERIRRVLFVGCESYTRDYHSSHFPAHEYWTLEPEPALRRFGAVRHVTGRLQDLCEHFPPGYFDLIVCNGVYGWGLDRLADCESAFSQCYTCLGDGGHLLLGWNDLPARDPAPLAKVHSLSRFSEYVFPPLGTSRYLTDTRYRHTYGFYRKSAS